MVKKSLRKVVALACSLALCFSAYSDESDFGAAVSVSATKKFSKRFDVGVEQEFRMCENVSVFDRSATSVDASFDLIPKWMEVGAAYSFLAYWDGIDAFDLRHRISAQISGKHKFGRFGTSLRGRFQSTYKDESVKTYKWNPKNYLRGKLEVSYKIPNSHIEPFVSAEMFYSLNNYKGNTIDNVRYEAGLDYKFSKKNAVSLSFRYDDEMNVKKPKDRFLISAGYKFKF